MVFGIYFGGFNIAGEINVVQVLDNYDGDVFHLWPGDFQAMEFNRSAFN